MLPSLFTLSLLTSFGIIIYQRMHINFLSHELSTVSCGNRVKRSLTMEDEQAAEKSEHRRKSIYFPLYAQISKKAMRKLCSEERRDRLRKGSNEKMKKRKRMKEMKSVYELDVNEDNRKNSIKDERKKCSRSVSFSPPRLISRRSHWNGCAFRDGKTWFVCEYHMGYTMLEFADASSLASSLPRYLRTLPYPYEGTDGTALNGSIVYAHDDQLVLHNFAKMQTSRLPLNIENEPLYNGSFSRVDAQSDEHGLWIVYREKGRKLLTAARVSIPALKVLHTWQLSVDPSELCNSFIRCGILHTIKCDGRQASIQPVYDFYSASSIVDRKTSVPGVGGEINSAQYDFSSHSITIFTHGSIYSIPIEE